MSEQPKPLYPEKYYERLLFFAEADLRAAELSLQGGAPFFHKPCFEARESAEKTLKAFIEAAGKEAPTLHSLPPLLSDCIAIDKNFGIFRGKCQTLNRYQSEARYPDEAAADYRFTESMAAEAVGIARELFDFVRDRIERRKRDGLL
ncbi:MAG: HEPN domain-containing protein [Abditibacteriales bacterium]|nr:HEPN domain-containing protein [Abditibacteriales bacterium]MDW8368565.1 HEPN domain-containing protein [Abditibacteriales bacterium]